jgi:hypothetical protein
MLAKSMHHGDDNIIRRDIRMNRKNTHTDEASLYRYVMALRKGQPPKEQFAIEFFSADFSIKKAVIHSDRARFRALDHLEQRPSTRRIGAIFVHAKLAWLFSSGNKTRENG